MGFVVEYAIGGAAPTSLGSVAAYMFGTHVLIGIGEGLITAMTVMAVLVAGQPQFVVTGTAIDLEPGRPVGLAIHAARPVEPLPHWQQMAARTSSRAAGRTLGRTLAASDHVDSVPMDGNLVGMPLLGALICETSSGRVALGADLPARMALGGMRVTAAPADGPIDIGMVVRAWWVSPHFRTHPVRAIGEHRL